MTIYIDAEYKCHVENDGTMTAVETDYFDGKCKEYIEGYRFIPSGESWTNPKGKVFEGEMIAPWKNIRDLNIAQLECENMQMLGALTAIEEGIANA